MEGKMNVRKQDKRLERVESSNNVIEIAFSTMVRRWLVQGKNGDWQLPAALTSKKSDSKRLIQRGGAVSRKRKPEQVKRSSKKAKTCSTSDAVSAYHIHNKLTSEFLERSKVRLLSCSRAQLTTRSHELSGEKPKAGPQYARAHSVGNDERPAFRNKTKAITRAVTAKDHQTPAKLTRETQKRVLSVNNEVLSTNGKRGTVPPSPKHEKRAKKHSVQAHLNIVNIRVGSSGSNTKKEEQKKSKLMKNTGSERVKGFSADGNTTKVCQLTSKQTSSAILVLCNGQRKCEKEGCYKAASQCNLCPTHGGQNKCRTQGCKNSSYSNGLCEVHDGRKSRTSGKTGRSAAEPNEGGSKSTIPVVASYNNSSCDRTTGSDKTTSTTKNRPKLQTRTKLVKTSTSDAWRTSDLPNLFRSASSQRAEDAAINVKQEPVDYASLTVPDGKPSVTKRQKTTNSRGGKANAVCKVVCCKESVASEGFCQTHSKRKRCQHEGCNNLAPKNALSDLCYRHGGRMKCQIKDCMKNAHYWELCSKHGGRPTCRNEGCDRAVYTRGLCSKHYREIQDPKASDTGRTRVKKEADRG